MADLLYDLGIHNSSLLVWFLIVISCATGFAGAAFLGSVRWWWIKHTRLPQLWRHERAQYLAKINRLQREAALKDAEIDRLKTTAFGTVVMEFRSAVQSAREA